MRSGAGAVCWARRSCVKFGHVRRCRVDFRSRRLPGERVATERARATVDDGRSHGRHNVSGHIAEWPVRRFRLRRQNSPRVEFNYRRGRLLIHGTYARVPRRATHFIADTLPTSGLKATLVLFRH